MYRREEGLKRAVTIINLQDFIIDHNRQFVIELDANLLPKELLKVCV